MTFGDIRALCPIALYELLPSTLYISVIESRDENLSYMIKPSVGPSYVSYYNFANEIIFLSYSLEA